MPITLTRSVVSKQRLEIDWVHPVPPARDDNRTEAAGPLPLKQALDILWEDDDRPLLVLRECRNCQGTDAALLSRKRTNDRTMLTTRWFRTVKLPASCMEPNDPFYNVFTSFDFGRSTPHFFLLADRESKPVAMSGMQTQSQLWRTLGKVLEQRYAKNSRRAVKKWLMLLDRFDTIESLRVPLKNKLSSARVKHGPKSSQVKKISKRLAELDRQRKQAEAEEKKVSDLGLLASKAAKAEKAAAVGLK